MRFILVLLAGLALPTATWGYANSMQLQMAVWKEGMIRISLAPDGAASGQFAWDQARGLLPQPAPAEVVTFPIAEGGKEFRLGEWRARVSFAPLTVRLQKGDRLVQDLGIDVQTGELGFELGDSPVLGFGEGAPQFDRRGGFFPLRNGQGPDTRQFGARIAVPLLIGTKGWALFINEPAGDFDLRSQRGTFRPKGNNASPRLDFFLFDSSEPTRLMEQLSRLTGPPALPPKWALGYMQSHRTLESTTQMLNIADTFRQKQLPCDAVIYLGTGFCPAGWNTGHDSFEFNPKVFDMEPAAFVKEMHARHFHVVLHTVPPQGQLHGNFPPAPGETLDALHIASYWARHRQVFGLGVDGWWPDEGDWMAVPARLARHRMYYDAALADRPNVRPWSLHRNGWAGIGRYGGWIWSGDLDSRWSTLAAQVAVGLNASLSVSPYWGTDTGGFIPTRELTGELYARWFQFSAFCPSFRSHGRTWHLRLPWGWNTGEVGPIEEKEYPAESELHNVDIESICRQYLDLRYRLLPYTYTLAREAHDTGLPLMRALWLHYPQDPEAVKQATEYLWGRDLLVAPVVEKGVSQRDVYLPAGGWFDWWTGEKTSGGRTVQRRVDLATMPIYVRAGAILPLDPVRQYVDEPTRQPTTLRIYGGADGKFVLYDDDGSSLDYLAGKASWTVATWKDKSRQLVIESGSSSTGIPQPRTFDLELLPGNTHRTVKYSGKRVETSF